jgi:hypothetical protein
VAGRRVTTTARHRDIPTQLLDRVDVSTCSGTLPGPWLRAWRVVTREGRRVTRYTLGLRRPKSFAVNRLRVARYWRPVATRVARRVTTGQPSRARRGWPTAAGGDSEGREDRQSESRAQAVSPASLAPPLGARRRAPVRRANAWSDGFERPDAEPPRRSRPPAIQRAVRRG